MDFYSNLDSRSLDRETPTLFEVISSNELENLLSPSVRFILIHYTNRYPRHLIKILNSFDEINLIIRGFIEYKFLKNWNSSFIEKFYGLKRVNALKLNISQGYTGGQLSKYENLKRLHNSQVLVSLFDLLMIPYIKEKLDILYDKLLPTYLLNQLKPNENRKDFLKYWFLKIYPTASTIFKLVNLLFKVLYLSGKFKSVTLLQYLFNINYSRFNQFDYELDEKRTASFLRKSTSVNLDTRIRPPSLAESVSDLYYTLMHPLKKSILFTSNSILPISIFLLKFLEWWNSSEINKNMKRDNVMDKVPVVPKLITSELSKIKKVNKLLKTNSSKCPICHEEIHNPAVIETGFVFCYTCIYKYLREADELTGGRCPVSGKRLLGCKYSRSSKEWKVNGVRRLMI
ncbi:hypothetical protein CANARDRAFT_30106 [[Candida] arabinofermentans NRRL YB-2248]|uniref:Peroxisome assembly protein 12 n=1 Tax=[Candida] arabinofermentans NRRL YB-2248 TaxID=983967 RepID=A0A1E4SV08_9ASCO|nr:hypothetical protein CANARDRAFT_30106 [[Candida] arabinofermentans NRRL YB-2248]